jgi:hypothetical protein
MNTVLQERHLARLVAASALFAWLVWTRAALEASPVLHIAVQLPALGLAGWLTGTVLAEKAPWLMRLSFNRHGLAGALTALFAIAFWMLPRSVDGALTSGTVEAAKFVTVPLLVGLPLALSLPRMGAILKGIVKANTLSMLAVLAWIYQAAPVRICNSYLVEDQRELGMVLFAIAIALAATWGIRALRGPAPSETAAPLATPNWRPE